MCVCVCLSVSHGQTDEHTDHGGPVEEYLCQVRRSRSCDSKVPRSKNVLWSLCFKSDVLMQLLIEATEKCDLGCFKAYVIFFMSSFYLKLWFASNALKNCIKFLLITFHLSIKQSLMLNWTISSCQLIPAFPLAIHKCCFKWQNHW